MGIFVKLKSVKGHKCEKCGHEWLPRTKGYVAKVCPKCKNPNWKKSK
jgi:uncharacterized OB-fold protein